MTQMWNFSELAVVYEALVDCNRRIGSLLERHAEPSQMAPIFGEKASLNQRLAQGLIWLESISAADAASQSLGETLTAQANAARSEARLVEQLAAFVPPVKKKLGIYQQVRPKGTGKEWDMKG